MPSASSLESSTLRTVALAGRPKRWMSAGAPSGLSQPRASQTLNSPGPAKPANMSTPERVRTGGDRAGQRDRSQRDHEPAGPDQGSHQPMTSLLGSGCIDADAERRAGLKARQRRVGDELAVLDRVGLLAR